MGNVTFTYGLGRTSLNIETSTKWRLPIFDLLPPQQLCSLRPPATEFDLTGYHPNTYAQGREAYDKPAARRRLSIFDLVLCLSISLVLSFVAQSM